jgi:hypothetical protein
MEHWVNIRQVTALGQQLSSVASAKVDVGLIEGINKELEERKVSIKPKS